MRGWGEEERWRLSLCMYVVCLSDTLFVFVSLVSLVVLCSWSLVSSWVIVLLLCLFVSLCVSVSCVLVLVCGTEPPQTPDLCSHEVVPYNSFSVFSVPFCGYRGFFSAALNSFSSKLEFSRTFGCFFSEKGFWRGSRFTQIVLKIQFRIHHFLLYLISLNLSKISNI